MTWVAPANVAEGGLLVPSLHYCQRRWSWWPRWIVVDMGYLAAEAKRYCRERWQAAILTKVRTDMKLVAPYVSWQRAECPQGQPLQWLGYEGRDQEHWFGVAEGPAPALCGSCWEATQCPRQFAFAASDHESLLGLLPLASRPAQVLLATGASADRTHPVLREEPTGIEPDVSEQSAVDLVPGAAGRRGRVAAQPRVDSGAG